MAGRPAPLVPFETSINARIDLNRPPRSKLEILEAFKPDICETATKSNRSGYQSLGKDSVEEWCRF